MPDKIFKNIFPQNKLIIFLGTLLFIFFINVPAHSFPKFPKKKEKKEVETVWVHRGFHKFSGGQFGNGGANIYVNANGAIEMINSYDVNNDSYVDLVLANSHDQIERGPTWVYTPDKGEGETWKKRTLSADSGWMSRAVDIDNDGNTDLVTVNSYNGVTSELNSYIYWGREAQIEASRSDFPTMGAYDVAVVDINRDGKLDLLFPSAWKDTHNPAIPRQVLIYLQRENREFENASDVYNLVATGALSIAAEDLNTDGYLDIVLASYRVGQNNLETESYIYWGTKNGVDSESPMILPTHGARQVILKDLNQDKKKDVIFSGSGQVRIYWNTNGNINIDEPLIIKATGHTSEFVSNAVRAEIADMDNNGVNDLILATSDGIEIRFGEDLLTPKTTLDMPHARWVTAADLNNNGYMDLIVSKLNDENLYETKSPIYWNGPSGFSPENVSWVATQGAMGNTAGDLDGDGQLDVVYNNTKLGHLSGIPSYIYLGNEQADYNSENRIELFTVHSSQALIADLDIDGYPESVFTIPKGIRIYKGTPEGPNNDLYDDVITNEDHFDLEVFDINRDGYLDLLTAAAGSSIGIEDPDKTSFILLGSKNGFSASRSYDVLKSRGDQSAVGDVNNDGHLDILFHDKRNYILIYLGSKLAYSTDRVWKVPCHGMEDSAAPNLADINNDGWLDIVVGILGHRRRHSDTVRVLFGSPDGYDPENSQELLAGYSSGFTAVADFNNDGNLDLLATAYANPTSRTPPAQVFYGNGKKLDFSNPVDLESYASGAVMQADLNRDGWIDIALGCHRNDIGHQVDSFIYWGSAEGFSNSNRTGIPGLGPHGMTSFDRGNAFNRKPEEHFISAPIEMGYRRARRIHWEADETDLLKVKLQIRWAKTIANLDKAKWHGWSGKNTYYEKSGKRLYNIPYNARWLQYKATLVSPYGCGTPRLHEVRIEWAFLKGNPFEL